MSLSSLSHTKSIRLRTKCRISTALSDSLLNTRATGQIYELHLLGTIVVASACIVSSCEGQFMGFVVTFVVGEGLKAQREVSF